MEILDKLPEELVWNVLKYMRHPLAEIMKPCIKVMQKTFDNNVVSDGFKLCFDDDTGSFTFPVGFGTLLLKEFADYWWFHVDKPLIKHMNCIECNNSLTLCEIRINGKMCDDCLDDYSDDSCSDSD